MFTYKLEIQWIDSTLSHWMSCSGLLDSKYQEPTVLYCIIEMLLSEMRDMRDTWQTDNRQPTILTFWLSRSAQDNPHTSYFIDFWSVSGHCIIATNCTMSDFLIWMTREERREVLPVVFSLLPGGGEGEKEKAQTQHQHLAVRSHLVTLLSQQAQYDGVMQLSRIEHMLPSTCRYWNTPILIKRRREHF